MVVITVVIANEEKGTRAPCKYGKSKHSILSCLEQDAKVLFIESGFLASRGVKENC